MRIRRLLLGMVAGNALGAALCALAYLVMAAAPDARAAVSVPSLFLVPLGIGLIAAWVWSPLDLGTGSILLHSLSCTLLALGVAALVFREGVICLVILSPMLYAAVLTGTLLGKVLFRRNRARLDLWIAPVLVLAVLAEPAVRRPHQSVVVDEIRISAPPSAVWPHLLAFEPIPDSPDYWLFRVGLSYPTETTNGGNFVGADRACRFSADGVFKERIAEIQPP